MTEFYASILAKRIDSKLKDIMDGIILKEDAHHTNQETAKAVGYIQGLTEAIRVIEDLSDE